MTQTNIATLQNILNGSDNQIGPNLEYILFYDNNGTGVFGNFVPCNIVLGTRYFKSGEAAYQSGKFTDNQILTYLESATAEEAWRIGDINKSLVRSDWYNINLSVMLEVLRYKFSWGSIHPSGHSFAKILLMTNDACLIEHTARDKFWGDGGNGSGDNNLGILLMTIRKELGGTGVVGRPNSYYSYVHRITNIPKCQYSGCIRYCYFDPVSGSCSIACSMPHYNLLMTSGSGSNIPKCQYNGCVLDCHFNKRSGSYSIACSIDHYVSLMSNRSRSNIPKCQYNGCTLDCYFDKKRSSYSIACSISHYDLLMSTTRSNIPKCQYNGCVSDCFFNSSRNSYSIACSMPHYDLLMSKTQRPNRYRSRPNIPKCHRRGCTQYCYFDKRSNSYSRACSIQHY